MEVLESNLDLSDEIGISTDYPLAARVRTELLCQDASLEVNNEGKERWVIKMVSQDALKATDGQTLNPGFVLTDSISITETEKYTKKMIAKNVFSRTDAFGVERKGKPNPKDLVGKSATVMLGTRTGDDGIERQSFTYIKKKAV